MSGDARRNRKGKRRGLRLRFHPLGWIGFALLGIWAYWWYVSITLMRLVYGRQTWLPAWNYLALDFLNSYYAVPYWLKGGDVYFEDFGDPINRPFAYAPVMLLFFLWVPAMQPAPAAITWMGVVAMIVGMGAYASWRVRTRLDLTDLTFPFILAAMLLSTPVLFAMERGNSDVIVLLMILPCAALLRRRPSWLTDAALAGCMALATWTKLYPVLLVPGLLIFGRRRAFILTGVFGILIAAVFFKPTLHWITISRSVTSDYPMDSLVFAHTISGAWPFIWRDVGLPQMKAIPGVVGAAFLLLPLMLWGSWHLYRCPQRLELAYPYFLWLASVGTFWWPVSMDYKLFFLPLAALAVWDRRDRPPVHACLVALLPWWQPFALNIAPWPLLLLKVLGLVGVTMALVARARELTSQAEGPAASVPAPAPFEPPVPTAAPAALPTPAT